MRFILAVLVLLPVSAVQAANVPLAQILPVCMAQSITEAGTAGAALGWPEADAAALDDWRQSFLGYNGGPVDVVGWREETTADGQSISFWIAGGVNAHRACAYSGHDGVALLAALNAHFGPPASLETLDFGTTAFWSHAGAEIAFSQVGTAAMVNISYSE